VGLGALAFTGAAKWGCLLALTEDARVFGLFSLNSPAMVGLRLGFAAYLGVVVVQRTSGPLGRRLFHSVVFGVGLAGLAWGASHLGVEFAVHRQSMVLGIEGEPVYLLAIRSHLAYSALAGLAALSCGAGVAAAGRGNGAAQDGTLV
jgi:hypothetical protein